MTPLRQRMLEDMRLRGLSPKTQEAYVGAVRQFVAHTRKPPDQISEEDLRQYFLYLTDDTRASRSTYTIALCGIKSFYQHTLRRDWPTLDPSLRSGQALVWPPREKKLPVVLSVMEVQAVLSCVHHLRYRICLSTIYACGLRLQEGVSLQAIRRCLQCRPAQHWHERQRPLHAVSRFLVWCGRPVCFCIPNH